MNFPRCLFFALLLPAVALPGQDLHFSQFYNHPLHYNPAQTGVFQGVWRAGGVYRGQWASVPVNYQSFAGAFDWKAVRRDNNLLALGLLLQRDQAGDAGLGWTQIGLTAGVSHALGEDQAVSAGFGLGVAQRTFDPGGLKFRNQWNGEVYDAALPTGENLARSSGFAPTLSAGLNWHFESAENRTQGDLGLGAAHLNRPKINFADDAGLRLPLRFALTARGIFQLGESLDLVLFGLGQQMADNREIIAGGGVRHWLVPAGAGQTPPTALQFSLATRVGDALIPAVQLERGAWTLGLSYDWNTSNFDLATRGRGGLELTALYRDLPAPPVKTFKTCPIF